MFLAELRKIEIWISFISTCAKSEDPQPAESVETKFRVLQLRSSRDQ